MFFEKLHTPQKNGTAGSNRPFGPFGVGKLQSCSATGRASRTATAQAEGGFMISAAWPEISALLFDESSQAKTSGGSTGTSFLNHSRTWRGASGFTVMLASFSGKWGPCPRNTQETPTTKALVAPGGKPNA